MIILVINCDLPSSAVRSVNLMPPLKSKAKGQTETWDYDWDGPQSLQNRYT